MLSDGFGESDDLFFEEKIKEKERLLQIQVSERNQNPALRDDLLNEGRIALWEVLQKRPDAPSAYLTASMKMRVVEVLTRGVFMGMEGHRGKAIDPLRRSDRDSFDDPDFEGVARAADTLDTVLLAYHEGEILEAIRSLPEKHQQYVILRFWGGLTNPEIAAVQQVKAGNMARTWNEAIRPVLAERLAHLSSL